MNNEENGVVQPSLEQKKPEAEQNGLIVQKAQAVEQNGQQQVQKNQQDQQILNQMPEEQNATAMIAQ